MKTFRYIRSIVWAIAILSFSACSNDDFLQQTDGENVTVTFSPTLGGKLSTRAIGDATGIDRLTVAVYEGSQTLSKKFSFSEEWAIAQRDGITLTLIEGHSYKILFWADDRDNTAYTLTDDGKITVSYNSYINGGFAKMEEMDAFCGTSTITVGSQKNENKQIELSRPLAQLNIADNTTQPTIGTHKSVVTFHSIPSSFNPFTGTVEMSNTDVTFTFTDFPTETLSVDDNTYYYLSSNYLFAPQTGTANVSATFNLQNTDGTSIKEATLSNIPLEKNMKTNVTGTIVQQPETWSVWDGTSSSKPDTDVQNRYIIDEAADIAWLCENGETLEENSTFLQTKDIDMNNSSGLASMKLPAGSTYNGGGKTIKNYKNSLFGDATNLTVTDLTVENVEAVGVTHVGTLVNTLKGNSSFSKITVNSSSATTTNGAAGGMVGYIVRTSENDRTETLSVSFSDCALNGITVSGSSSEGKYVGLLSGYDNNESLSFDATCEAADVAIADYTSVYTKANNSVWVEGTLDAKYDGWLGHETYRRAKITFAGVRLAPRWDGSTKTASGNLLLYGGASGKYEVQSPFDLAGVRAVTASPSALYLMENVDMNGQGPDGKFFVHGNFTKSAADAAYSTTDDDYHFKSFNYVDYLDGNNNSIYNLSIYSTFNGATTYYGAFILYCRNTTVHQNINLRNCCTVVPHVVKEEEDKSYGAAFVCNNDCSTYTMDNVHAYDCKVFALQKVGTLVGRLGVNSSGTINNCTVKDCYIENYKCTEHQESFAGVVKFYSYGEVGGMFGFVEDQAKITNCHVYGTTIYAFGQDDKNYIFTKIPGRHIGSFIGDIRTSDNDGDTIIMENCTVDSNTKCTNRWDKYTKCSIIGKAYYVALAGDSKGTVKFDGSPIL